MRGHRLLGAWLTAECLSLVGTRLAMVAVPWLVLEETGSASLMGLVAFAEMTPLVLLKALGGPIIDRLGARRVAMVCDSASAVALGAVPLLHLLGLLSFPVLLVLVAVFGALRGPGDAAKYSMVPAVAAGSGVPTERVTGLASTVERTASMAGAAVAGALVVAVGPANALVVNAVAMAASALVTLTGLRALRPVASTEEADELGYRAQLRAGWRFLRHEPLILALSVMVALTNLVDLAWTAVLLPVWAATHGYSAAAVGGLMATFSAFAIGGSLVAAAWGDRIPRFRTYLVAFLVCGAPRFLVLALDTSWWVIIAVAMVGGFASGFLNPILGAVYFERIPAHLVGRVSSLTTSMAWGLMPLGGLVGGALVSGVGITGALVVAGLAYLTFTLLPAVRPSFRAMDERPAAGPVGTAAGDEPLRSAPEPSRP